MTLVSVTVSRVEPTVAILFVILPIARVNAAVSVDFAAEAVDAILQPVAFIQAAVSEDVSATAVPHLLSPLRQ